MWYFLWQPYVSGKATWLLRCSPGLCIPHTFPHQLKATLKEALLLATEVPHSTGVSEQPIWSELTQRSAENSGWKVVWGQIVEGPECQAKSLSWMMTQWQQHFKKIQLTVSF